MFPIAWLMQCQESVKGYRMLIASSYPQSLHYIISFRDTAAKNLLTNGSKPKFARKTIFKAFTAPVFCAEHVSKCQL